MPEVLIIEDDTNIATFMKINFELEGFSVIQAFDGEEAIQIISNRNPDLIILDLMIPKKDGWEVLEYMKKRNISMHTPVIITSAKTQKGDLDKGASLGVTEYVTKPFDPVDLVGKVKAILSNQENKS